jgi:sec-independent protein translocase protein TatB
VFNIGPMEFVILALVGVVVIGPDRLPQFARDAARMIRTLRDMATGARQQLREELGPEFADIDLRNLNPRTAVQRAVFGDELPDLRKYSPGNIMRDVVYGEAEDGSGGDVPASTAEPASTTEPADDRPVSMTKPGPAAAPGGGASVNGSSANGSSANGSRPRPRPRPRTSYDEDAT